MKYKNATHMLIPWGWKNYLYNRLLGTFSRKYLDNDNSKEITLIAGIQFIIVWKNLFENTNFITFKVFCVVLFHRLKVLNRKVVLGQAFIQNS